MNTKEHLLSCLAEECNEVAHRVSKALRFGTEEVQPNQPLTNAQRIEEEFVDLLAVWGLLADAGIVSADGLPDLEERLERKVKRIHEYMVHAKASGALED